MDQMQKIWALQEAAKPSGFTPHARGTVDFLISLESEGLVRQSDVAPFWMITDAGRAELGRLTNGQGEQK